MANDDGFKKVKGTATTARQQFEPELFAKRKFESERE